MTEITRNVLLIFAALLPIVNPLGMAPIFAEMTLGYPDAVRRTVAFRVAVNGVGAADGLTVRRLLHSAIFRYQPGGGAIGRRIGGARFAGWQILNKKGDMSDRQVDRPRTIRRFSRKLFTRLPCR